MEEKKKLDSKQIEEYLRNMAKFKPFSFLDRIRFRLGYKKIQVYLVFPNGACRKIKGKLLFDGTIKVKGKKIPINPNTDLGFLNNKLTVFIDAISFQPLPFINRENIDPQRQEKIEVAQQILVYHLAMTGVLKPYEKMMKYLLVMVLILSASMIIMAYFNYQQVHEMIKALRNITRAYPPPPLPSGG